VWREQLRATCRQCTSRNCQQQQQQQLASNCWERQLGYQLLVYLGGSLQVVPPRGHVPAVVCRMLGVLQVPGHMCALLRE
jgi:hypothetical protein